MTKKIPAIKSNIGNWTYYTTSLSFNTISQIVDKMSDELYQSDSLKKALQRNITENYKNIEQYILSQKERFFNAIVLAIYDGQPQWMQVDLDLENETFYNFGFLVLNGKEHIFPIDGQHRVEGIKSALKNELNKDTYKDEKIPVVFIGHVNTEEGIQKSRRLFNTLNRYAKPVSQSDIIILEEDDVSAITTRFLIEDTKNVTLFKGKRVDDSLQKAINSANKISFTSLIAFYECNVEIQKYYFKNKFLGTDEYNEYKEQYYPNTKLVSFNEFKRYRPKKEVLNKFINFTEEYWNYFQNSLPCIQNYLNSNDEKPAENFRNSTDGGNILFRPIGILPFIEASLKLMEKNDSINIKNVFKLFVDKIEFIISEKPWKNVLWSPQDSTMLSPTKPFIRNLLIYQIDKNILTEHELNNLKINYSKYTSFNGDLNNTTLQDLIEME